jgi:hypothetical protein
LRYIHIFIVIIRGTSINQHISSSSSSIYLNNVNQYIYQIACEKQFINKVLFLIFKQIELADGNNLMMNEISLKKKINKERI